MAAAMQTADTSARSLARSQLHQCWVPQVSRLRPGKPQLSTGLFIRSKRGPERFFSVLGVVSEEPAFVPLTSGKNFQEWTRAQYKKTHFTSGSLYTFL